MVYLWGFIISGMDDRNVVSASLLPADKRLFKGVVDELGMQQQECLGRLIRWFHRQDRLAQIMMMDVVPASDEVVFLEVLELKRRRVWGENLPETTEEREELAARVARLLQKQRAQRKRE